MSTTAKSGLSIVNFRHAAKGSLVGYVDIRLESNGLLVRNCAVLFTREGDYVVKMPEYRDMTDPEKPRYVPCVEWTAQARRDQWSRAAARLVEEHLAEHNPGYPA